MMKAQMPLKFLLGILGASLLVSASFAPASYAALPASVAASFEADTVVKCYVVSPTSCAETSVPGDCPDVQGACMKIDKKGQNKFKLRDEDQVWCVKGTVRCGYYFDPKLGQCTGSTEN